MAEIKFYQDKEKTTQVYPEINPDGIYPGVTVGLADNLTSPDGVTFTGDSLFYTSGGTASITDGYAKIIRITGNAISTSVPESIEITHYETQYGIPGLNKDTFKNKVGSTAGVYTFVYTPHVTYTSNPSNLVVSLNDVVFSKKTMDYMTYTFTYQGAENGWKLNGSSINLDEYGIVTTGNEVQGNTISVTYQTCQWHLNGGSSTITISQYGISFIGGSSVPGDLVEVTYQAAVDGVIQVAQPTGLLSCGFNQINKDGAYVFIDHNINVDGKIVPSVGNYVVCFRGVSSTVSSYTIENYTGGYFNAWTLNRMAPPTSTTQFSKACILPPGISPRTGQHYANTATQRFIQSDDENFQSGNWYGVALTGIESLENLCIHLTWSDSKNGVTENYWENVFSINYTDKYGNIALPYGLVKVGENYYDEINYVDKKIYRRVERSVYSAAELQRIQALNVPYLYDLNYIYYGIPTETSDLADNIVSTYQVSDFGTEQFLNTSISPGYTIFYQNNLKDKIRTEVEVLSNKVTSIDSSSTDSQYPSAAAVYNMDYAVRALLGIHVDIPTFSMTSTYTQGSYVIYGGLLYQCHTAVTQAGAWTGNTNWTLQSLFVSN